MDKKISVSDSTTSISEFPYKEKRDTKDDQVLKEAYMQASKDPDRLKTIKEWEALD